MTRLIDLFLSLLASDWGPFCLMVFGAISAVSGLTWIALHYCP